MTDWKNKTYTSSTTGELPVTADKLKQIMTDFEKKELDRMSFFIKHASGITILPDYTGLMVPPNGFALIVGEKLYDRLKGLNTSECDN